MSRRPRPQLLDLARRVRHRRGPDPRRAVRPRRASAARVDVRHPVRCREILGEPGGTEGVDDAFAERHGPGIGAEIMGAGQVRPARAGRTTRSGAGGGATNPPFHTPTFVLTHRPRPSIEMEGGTTFHFLDAAPAEALEVAREAAGGQDVRIGGGPTMVRDVPRRRPRRPPARRAGADPARPRRPAVGRPGGRWSSTTTSRRSRRPAASPT